MGHRACVAASDPDYMHQCTACNQYSKAILQLQMSLLKALSRRGWKLATIITATKYALIALQLAILLAWAKYSFWPSAEPEQEWLPKEWGHPWFPACNTWAAVARQRRVYRELVEPSEATDWEAQACPIDLTRSAAPPLLQQPRAPRLKYPIVWAAPFFSRSGYGTEAISYVAGLLENKLVAPEDLWLVQAGDVEDQAAVDGLDPAIRELLFAQEWRNITKRLSPVDRDRPIIAICHVFPDCWRTAAEDAVSRWAFVRWWQSFVTDVKSRVFGVVPSTGCPCPNQYITDRVVFRVGRSMFETEKLPAPLVDYTNYLDELLVPSRFSVDSFASSGVKPDKLHILPQGINTTLFNPDKHGPICLGNFQGEQVTGIKRTYLPDPPMTPTNASSTVNHAYVQRYTDASGREASPRRSAPFRFLSVFKWETRKGWDILIQGYLEEFTQDEDVELHVVTHAFSADITNFRDFMRAEIMGCMAEAGFDISEEALDTKVPRIYLYDKYIPDHLYPSLYQSMDALIVPTHGEGWGRPQFEAMAMGKPVISTNWSGLTAFMDDTVSYPIKVESLVEIDDQLPGAFEWFQGQRWAQPSRKHMRELMRRVMHNRDEAAEKGQAAKKRIQTEYSIPAVAKKLLVQLQRLQTAADNLLHDDILAPLRSAYH